MEIEATPGELALLLFLSGPRVSTAVTAIKQDWVTFGPWYEPGETERDPQWSGPSREHCAPTSDPDSCAGEADMRPVFGKFPDPLAVSSSVVFARE